MRIIKIINYLKVGLEKKLLLFASFIFKKKRMSVFKVGKVYDNFYMSNIYLVVLYRL